jgi:hypothetical protein
VRERESEKEGERDKEEDRGCPELLFLFSKGMTGALAPFSYLVDRKPLKTELKNRKLISISITTIQIAIAGDSNNMYFMIARVSTTSKGVPLRNTHKRQKEIIGVVNYTEDCTKKEKEL